MLHSFHLLQFGYFSGLFEFVCAESLYEGISSGFASNEEAAPSDKMALSDIHAFRYLALGDKADRTPLLLSPF